MILTVITPTADILGNPQQPNIISNADSQLLYGETFEVTASHGAYVLGKSSVDGYEGYVERAHLIKNPLEANGFITAPSTHLYELPDFKSRPLMPLSFFSRVFITGENERGFSQTSEGWIFTDHLQEVPALNLNKDLAEVALQFFGTPYLYGGRSKFGIDCSALVQMSMMGLGHDCPLRDCKDQEKTVGKAIERSEIQRNDIVYFKGHTGIMIDESNIVNATARFMSTVIEPLNNVEKACDGITAIRRIKNEL